MDQAPKYWSRDSALKIEALIALGISERERSPASDPCSSTTQTQWTRPATALSITSDKVVSAEKDISILEDEWLESVAALQLVLGPVNTFLVNSRTGSYNQECCKAIGHPLKSVAEKVPISLLPLPCNLDCAISWSIVLALVLNYRTQITDSK